MDRYTDRYPSRVRIRSMMVSSGVRASALSTPSTAYVMLWLAPPSGSPNSRCSRPAIAAPPVHTVSGPELQPERGGQPAEDDDAEAHVGAELDAGGIAGAAGAIGAGDGVGAVRLDADARR
ncbi:hypothetical protein [Saccharopolyspora pogona]|uniref:hypothetical protein n=1 Tax=Saccharopolyspora pogona TaxID=333966 RepID=UPI001685F118|nr:hypothetical protein [Saccharopolyspora pogona]